MFKDKKQPVIPQPEENEEVTHSVEDAVFEDIDNFHPPPMQDKFDKFVPVELPKTRQDVRGERRRSTKISLEELTQKMEKNIHEDAGTDQFMKNHNLITRTDTTWASSVSKFLDSRPVLVLLVITNIIALFLFDIDEAYFPPSLDLATVWTVVVVFIIFVMEICLSLASKSNYFLSFYMILDLVGTLSLIPDILVIFDNSVSSSNDLNVARAGRVGRLARTAGSLRFTKFARLFRVIRLVRVARIFRVMHSRLRKFINASLYDDKDPLHNATPSKLGVVLSDTIAKRIVLMIIIMITVIPYLDAEQSSSAVVPMTPLLDMYELLYVQNQSCLQSITDILVSNEPTIFLLFVGNVSLYDKTSDNVNLRQATEVIQEISTSGNSTILMNNKIALVTEALFHMYLIMFVVGLFALGSFIISRDAFELVVKPIERMTSMIRKLAGTICILSSSGVPEDAFGDIEDHEENETIMLENTVAKLAQIFDVRQDNKSADKESKKTKAERMLTGSKTTKILAHGSVYNISVTEKTPSVIPNKSHSVQTTNLLNPTSNNPNEKQLSVAAIQKEHPELSSMEEIMNNPDACVYLKLFLSQKLQIENYNFWSEVEKYKAQFTYSSERIAHHYIENGAISQINIEASLRVETLGNITNGAITLQLFDKCKAEIYKVLNQNNYSNFLASDYCKEYLIKRDELIKSALENDISGSPEMGFRKSLVSPPTPSLDGRDTLSKSEDDDDGGDDGGEYTSTTESK